MRGCTLWGGCTPAVIEGNAMPRAIIDGQCGHCGEPVRGAYGKDGLLLCLECRLSKARDAAIQMANHEGPAYDAWVRTRGPLGRPRTGISTGGTDEA